MNTAYDKLLDMVHHLEFTGNTSSLKVLVDAAKGLEEQFYTAESWKPFTEALKEAEAVLADENATQAQVQAAHDNLRNAEFGLRLIPNKDALEDLINKVENMDLSKYSDDVQKEIRSALDNAKAVMADENATQDDVDGAVKLLQASVDKAEGTTATDNKKPSTSGKDQSKDKAAKTGDATSPIGWGVAGILGVFAAVVAFFERKKRRQ